MGYSHLPDIEPAGHVAAAEPLGRRSSTLRPMCLQPGMRLGSATSEHIAVRIPSDHEAAVAQHLLWHAQHHAPACLASLQASTEGLTERQAAERLRMHGPNVIAASAPAAWYRQAKARSEGPGRSLAACCMFLSLFLSLAACTLPCVTCSCVRCAACTVRSFCPQGAEQTGVPKRHARSLPRRSSNPLLLLPGWQRWCMPGPPSSDGTAQQACQVRGACTNVDGWLSAAFTRGYQPCPCQSCLFPPKPRPLPAAGASQQWVGISAHASPRIPTSRLVPL